MYLKIKIVLDLIPGICLGLVKEGKYIYFERPLLVNLQEHEKKKEKVYSVALPHDTDADAFERNS